MNDNKRNVMKAIKMKRFELLELVNTNMVKHVADYNEAVEDFKSLVLTVAQANLKFAKTADLEQFKKIRPIPGYPVSYEDQYKRAARMLECSVDDVIEVEEDVFNQLVLDEWAWKRSFTTTNALYKAGIGG